MSGPRQTLPETTPPGAVTAAAADWVVRLQARDAGEAEWLAFEAWLGAAPDARRAYDAAMSVWLLADAVDQGEVERPRRGLATPALGGPGARTWGLRTWGALGLGAASLAVVAVTVTWSPMTSKREPTPAATEQVYATARGERRTVRLADGSEIDLSGDSRVAIGLAPSQRRVTMTRGEAAFSVTHDPRRPFTVSVGDREIRDLGTEFDVRLAGPQIRVQVRQGLVEVSARDHRADAPIALSAGRQLLHDEGSDVSTVRSVTIADVFAWKEGRLIYRDQPLGVVVSDLNRYFPHAVRIEGARTAALRFTGVLAVDGEEATIRRLVALLPISATRVNGAMVLKVRDDAR
jgi:transmembrane sensor